MLTTRTLSSLNALPIFITNESRLAVAPKIHLNYLFSRFILRNYPILQTGGAILFTLGVGLSHVGINESA